MKKDEIYHFVTQVLKEKCEVVKPLSMETNLEEELELDSIFLLTLAVAIENHYKIILNENDSDGILKIGDLVLLIEKRLDEFERGLNAPC